MRFCLLLLAFMLLSYSAFAACASPDGVAGSVNYDDTTKTQSVCDGTNWKIIEVVDYSTGTGARVSNQIANDTGSCTADKTGRIRYDGTSTWAYCNGSAWVSFHRGACVGPSSCPDIGDVCTDGTVFIGCPAPTYHRTFMTRCDAGQTFGTSCTGTRQLLPWNNGNSTGYTSTAVTGLDGAADTVILVAADSDSGVGGTQPHQAAAYCDSLSIHGKTDWYLPSRLEMWSAHINLSIIGGLSAVDWYWTTGQASSSQAWYLDMYNNGGLASVNKNDTDYLRCTRHD